jgi:hypothetical protein
VRAAIAMKTAMSASAMHFKEFFIAMSASILAIQDTRQRTTIAIFSALRVLTYYKEYVLRTHGIKRGQNTTLNRMHV